MAGDPGNWTREFDELGANKVRANLLSDKWSREKRAAARMWIETADALAWQKSHREGQGETHSLILTLRSAKWWRYGAPGLIAAFGLALLLRRLF